jgi:L-amino acid N-acyltransferase YncA
MQIEDISGVLKILKRITKTAGKKYRNWVLRNMTQGIGYYLANEDKSALIVAEEKGQIIGYVIAGIIREEEKRDLWFLDYINPDEAFNWLYLQYVAVDPDCHGKGMGSKLLRELDKIAKEKKLKGVYTGTRGKTKEFYLKNGYQEDKIFLLKRAKLL